MPAFVRSCLGMLVLASCVFAQDFAKDVQPLFRKRCLACHGPAMQTSGLRLDRRDDALRGGYSGPVIQPGNSNASKLIHLVEGKDGRMMPPAGPKLSADEVAVLRGWIDKGAEWPVAAVTPEPARPRKSSHWAFQPIRRPEPPAVQQAGWVRNQIDSFVLARLEAGKVAPSPEADRAALLRRLHLDLVGLPPSPEEVRSFLSDTRPDADERVVDRLLASPHFGEKWARHWLDLARYADSDGYQKDEVRPNAWRYRDWVIQAINGNLPFDQFTVEQVAGDLLPDATVGQRTATGFHRQTLTSREAGVDRAQVRAEQVADRANTFGSVWLGLTVGCATCHDHKFDPISQKEYYQLYAYFNTSREASLHAPLPEEMGPYLLRYDEYQRKRQAVLARCRVPELEPEFWDKMRAASRPGASAEWVANYELLPLLVDDGYDILAKQPAQRTGHERYLFSRFFLRTYGRVALPEAVKGIPIKQCLEQLDKLDEQHPRYSEPLVLAELAQPPKTHIHIRGDFREPGIEVQPGTLAALPPLPDGTKPDRLALARWLVSPEHPLTARVAVNRLWQELFGRGLVTTSEDFGTRGEPPSHPDLLDWLAADFRSDWDVKRALRQMALSATYRQSSRPRPDLAVADPGNRLLARQSRHRLPAELIRDSALAVSGLLNPAIGGRSVRPPLPPGVTDIGFEDFMKWPETLGPDRYRRGLYTLMHRSVPYPQLVMFDAPDGLASCSRRTRSTTPLQALTLLNDPVFVEAAQGLAARVLRDRPMDDTAGRIRYAVLLALSRPPSEAEAARLAAYYQQQRERQAAPSDVVLAAALNTDPAEAKAWVGLCSVLLNLDEFLTRE